MIVDWTTFKAFVDDRDLSIQYVLINATYWLKAFDGPFNVETTIYKKTTADDPSDQKDFEDNYQANANRTFTDGEGSLLNRTKMASAGWTYQARFMEFTTSTLASVLNEKENGTDWADATIKFYDNVDAELTVQGDLDTDCVKTVFDFEPVYDMEIIGGNVTASPAPTNDMRLWVIAVPDIAVEYGGSKNMVNQLNLKKKSSHDIDGRTPKRMNYDATYHTNKLRIIIKHSAGAKESVMMEVEHFKL